MAMIRHAPASQRDSRTRWARGRDNIPRILPRRAAERKELTHATGNSGSDRFHVLIIDPQPLTRGCLVAAVESAPYLASVTSAEGVPAVLQLVDEGARFDTAIVNLDRSVTNEVSLLEALMPLKLAIPDTPLLLIVACTTPACLSAAFQHGVRGYLASDTSLSVTLDALQLICSGWMIYPAFKQESVPANLGGMTIDDAIAGRLTPRQEQVLQYLIKGLPNKSIAFHLQMSESTVKAHIKEIMQRVGAANRTQVVALLGKNDGTSS